MFLKDAFNKYYPYDLHFTFNNLLNIKKYDNTLILDMFDTIAYICYTDFYTSRDEDVNNISKLSICIPVINYEIFKSQKEKFEQLLKFMTNGEEWNIEFKRAKKQKILTCDSDYDSKVEYNSIALLSGGLDSLSGTINEKSNKTIFVTFDTNSIELSNSKKIYEKLLKTENNCRVAIKKLSLEDSVQYTERTRSLMFIACCLIYADFFQINKINLYENGIMSLNPKFNFSRRVTKTTNQKTLYLINTIFSNVGINIKVVNPFKYLTKTEVISRIPKEYLEVLRDDTRTCSKNSRIVHFINKSKGNFHCGVCIACILRQIGTINCGLYEFDNNYLLPSNLIKFNDILSYEKSISKNHRDIQDYRSARYKYFEKKSLIEYYKSFYRNIKNGRIVDYIELNPIYYDDEDYYNNLNDMLNRFSKELEKYFEHLED